MTLNNMVPLADLIAQFSMAESARIMLGLTVVQIGIGIAGTISLLWTIWQAQQSQGLAATAIELQREMSQRELRAYLTVKIELKDSPKGMPPSLYLIVENQGKTPAIITSFKVDIETRPISEDYEMKLNDYVGHHGPVGAGETCEITTYVEEIADPVNSERLKLVGNSLALVIMVFAEITYTDAFEFTHITSFGRSFRLDKSGKELRTVSNIGDNSMRTISHSAFPHLKV